MIPLRTSFLKIPNKTRIMFSCLYQQPDWNVNKKGSKLRELKTKEFTIFLFLVLKTNVPFLKGKIRRSCSITP